MNKVSDHQFPENTDDVLVKINRPASFVSGDSLYRIGWYDGTWYTHDHGMADVVEWCEISAT